MKDKVFRYRKLTVVSVVVLALLVGGLALSQPVADAHKKGMEILSQVLTPRQFKVIRDFMKAHKDDRKEMIRKKREHIDRALQLEEELGITDDQKKELFQIVVSNRDAIHGAIEPLVESKLALHNAVTQEAADESALKNAAAQVGDDLGDLAVLAASMVKDARDVLTPEQISILENAMAERHAEEREHFQRMPEMVDELIALEAELDLTPEQISTLLDLGESVHKIMEEHHKIKAKLVELKLKNILTPEQFGMLMDFKAEHADGHKQKRKEHAEKTIALWRELDLTKDQMDGLAEIAASKKDFVVPAIQSVTEAAWQLRDDILSGNADESRIRESAALFGDVLGDAAVVMAEISGDARSILTPEQVETLDRFAEEGEAEAREHVARMPEHFDAMLELIKDLNLTPEQKEELRDLKRTHLKMLQDELLKMESPL